MTIQQYLERLKEVERAATRGPWKFDDCLRYLPDPNGHDEYIGSATRSYACEGYWQGIGTPPVQALKDAAFIAESRTAIPTLIKLVEEFSNALSMYAFCDHVEVQMYSEERQKTEVIDTGEFARKAFNRCDEILKREGK